MESHYMVYSIQHYSTLEVPREDGVHGQHLEQKDPGDYNAFRG